MEEYKDITQHEIEALKVKYNLADAHTHQSQSITQRNIIKDLDKLWYLSEKTKQHKLEEEFIDKFFAMKNIDCVNHKDVMLHYSASVSTIHIANYLLKNNLSVSLLEPCFDNIYDILDGFSIKIEPIEESVFLRDHIYDRLCETVKTDCIFIIDPNNPTGFSFLDKSYKKDFEELLRYCKDYNKILIIDYCFSNFLLGRKEINLYNPYYSLKEYNITYIAIEDTGKTWPTQDAKISLVSSSSNIYLDLYSIYTTYILNVSPFILILMISYIDNSINDNFKSMNNLLDKNRKYLKDKMNKTFINVLPSRVPTSVAWCAVNKQTSLDVQKILVDEGIYTISGSYFFWSNKEKGSSFIRVALARNHDMFFPAVEKLSSIIKGI